MLKEQIQTLKNALVNKDAAFGVDLLLPQVGGSARATNKSYVGSNEQLDELVDIIIDAGTSLFVSAVGVPPKFAVDKLHQAKIPIMNMVGHPKHVKKALDAGCDIICAQGGEGGGHTGAVPTTVLIPKVVDICRGKKSPLTGKQVPVIAAGGLYNGRSLAASLMFGADAVWVGTRFVCAKEAGAPKAHQEAIVTAGYDDTIRTLIFTGRPLRVKKNPFIMDWENKRKDELLELTGRGVLPAEYDLDRLDKEGKLTDELMDQAHPFLMGNVAAVIDDVKTAKEIVDEMVTEAVEIMKEKHNTLRARL